jgi:hypothetical protein
MPINYRDAVGRALLLHQWFLRGEWHTANETAEYLGVTRPCAKRWIDAASIHLLITERTRPTDNTGPNPIEYKLIC